MLTAKNVCTKTGTEIRTHDLRNGTRYGLGPITSSPRLSTNYLTVIYKLLAEFLKASDHHGFHKYPHKIQLNEIEMFRPTQHNSEITYSSLSHASPYLYLYISLIHSALNLNIIQYILRYQSIIK